MSLYLFISMARAHLLVLAESKMHSRVDFIRYHRVLCDEEFETIDKALFSHHSRRRSEPVNTMGKHTCIRTCTQGHTSSPLMKWRRYHYLTGKETELPPCCSCFLAIYIIFWFSQESKQLFMPCWKDHCYSHSTKKRERKK